MRIGIVGLGYVGLTLGIAAADSGIEVFGVETSAHIIESLRNNHAHFFEPNLNSLIKLHNGKDFFCVESFPKGLKFDAFVITVGTPLREGKKEPDYEYIKNALKSVIKESYDGSQLIVLRSTVSVGTTRKIVLPFLSEIIGLEEDKLFVSMSPERTVEGKAVEELRTLPQIVSGNNERALEMAITLFRHLTDYVIPVSSLEEAELVKLYCNTYRDMFFALGNAFCMAAQTFGVNGLDVIRYANKGYQRSNIAAPGFVAGPCLEKDAYILINNMEECPSRDFILSGRKLNESWEDMVVEWVKEHCQGEGIKRVVAISGLAFKGQPETTDLRGSSAINIAKKLKNVGYCLHLHDFLADEGEIKRLALGKYFKDVYEAAEGASVLLVLNNHKRYFDLQGDLLDSEKRTERFLVLDAWGVCSNLRSDGHIEVKTLGDMMIKENI